MPERANPIPSTPCLPPAPPLPTRERDKSAALGLAPSQQRGEADAAQPALLAPLRSGGEVGTPRQGEAHRSAAGIGLATRGKVWSRSGGLERRPGGSQVLSPRHPGPHPRPIFSAVTPRAYPRHSSRGRKRHPGGRGVGASSGS